MRPHNFNIRHLAAVAAVIEHGSVSQAARLVNLTQPAVTQGIAKLEAQLGLPLFDRAPGTIAPTQAALTLLPRIEVVLRLVGSSRVTMAQIRAFVALARAGSYAAATLEAKVAQPTLHRAVSDLALAINARIVARNGRSITLTRQGAALARRFQLAVAELRSLLEDVADMLGKEVGRVVVGAMPLSRVRLLPQAISACIAAFPQIEIAIHEGSFTELAPSLRDGSIDMMLGALREPSVVRDLHQRFLFVDRPTIVARAGHPLAKGWDSDALSAHRWILPSEGTPLRDLWKQMFEAMEHPCPRVPIECGSVLTIRQLLIGSDFLTMLSPDQVAMELDAGILVDLGPVPGDLSRTIGLTTRMDWRPTRMQRNLIGMIESVARNMNS